jgi:hypothetical protein
MSMKPSDMSRHIARSRVPHFYDYAKDYGYSQEDSISINHFANLLQLLIYTGVYTYSRRFQLGIIANFVKKHRSGQNGNPGTDLQSKNTQLV